MIIFDLFKLGTLVPLFGSRPFLTSFLVSATAATLPEQLPAPLWFIHPFAIGLLGALATLEFLARMNPDIRAIFDEIDGWIKASLSLVVSFALVDPETAELLVIITGTTVDNEERSLIWTMFSLAWSSLMGAGAWYVSTVRRSFMSYLYEIDEDDDLGIQAAIHYLESLGVGFGVLISLFVPLVALIIYLVIFFALSRWQKRMDALEKSRQTPCPNCEAMNSRMALHCHSCGYKCEKPQKVGWLGQMTDYPVQNRALHRHNLTTKKRCSSCATKLPAKSIRQMCQTCQTETFSSLADIQTYLAQLDKELPLTIVISGGLSFIPVIGIIPGLIYYRLSLIASLRRYIPRTIGCATRWGIRLLNLFLLLLQPIPVIGIFAMPLMVYTNYRIYRGIFIRLGTRAHGKY